jgi:hypothetical protein
MARELRRNFEQRKNRLSQKLEEGRDKQSAKRGKGRVRPLSILNAGGFGKFHFG